MSRVSQFIEYINNRYEPTAEDKLGKYTDITIDKNMKKARKKHQKNLKNEQIRWQK